jgi:tetratricopeptide (TPR) repeat protein
VTTVLEQARAAYRRRDWPLARDRFAVARANGELAADDFYCLGDAYWWLGENEACLEACGAAYRLQLATGQPRRAAIAALDIATVHFLRGEDTVGSGWLSRARRLLDGEPEAAEHGYILYLVEVEGPLGGIAPAESEATERVLAAARRVHEIGVRHGDPTLVAAAILGEGRALVRAGRVAEGLALLDEAMVAVVSDELNPAWAGNIYCNLMSAAEEVGALRRARLWTEATTRWLATLPAAVIFNGICRVHRSWVGQLTGAWSEAEREAERVCEELAGLHRRATARAHYQVGEIRRLRGDFAAAEGAYERAHGLGHDPQPGLALLRLAQGRPAAALRSIRSAVLAEPSPPVRARLRAAQVEIALAPIPNTTGRVRSGTA